MFSIKVCEPGEDAQIVGHLPMEISRTTLLFYKKVQLIPKVYVVNTTEEALLFKKGLKFLAK